MAAKSERVSKRYRATADFETALASVWDELIKIPELAAVEPERLKQEMFFIWQVGGNYLRQPTRPDRVRRVLIAADEAEDTLHALLENLRKYVHIYDRQLFSTAYLSHPMFGKTEGSPLDPATLLIDITNVLADIGIAKMIFATFPGLAVSKNGKLVVSRKATSAPLANIAHVAMKSWRLLAKKDFQFPKGLIKTKKRVKNDTTVALGPRPRPIQDDAYFIFLCLKLTANLDDPASAITAVRRARAARITYQKELSSQKPKALESVARADFIDKNDDLARRMIYGLKY